MNSESQSQGGAGTDKGPGEPLEPGRPDIMPNPAVDPPSGEGEQLEQEDDEALAEEDMGDVDVNNSVSQENPPQR